MGAPVVPGDGRTKIRIIIFWHFYKSSFSLINHSYFEDMTFWLCPWNSPHLALSNHICKPWFCQHFIKSDIKLHKVPPLTLHKPLIDHRIWPWDLVRWETMGSGCYVSKRELHSPYRMVIHAKTRFIARSLSRVEGPGSKKQEVIPCRRSRLEETGGAPG